jgi:hypothetical protein
MKRKRPKDQETKRPPVGTAGPAVRTHRWMEIWDTAGRRVVCQTCGAVANRDWISVCQPPRRKTKLTLLDGPLFTNRWDTGIVDW